MLYRRLKQKKKEAKRTRRQEKNNSWDSACLPVNVKQQRLIRQVNKRTTTEAYLLLLTNCPSTPLESIYTHTAIEKCQLRIGRF